MATLSQALKALRFRRGLRSVEVARAMDISHRNYQRFERGELGLDHDKVFAFAEAIRADPWGIILGAEFGSVKLAVASMENQGVSLLLAMLRRFDRRAGQDLAALDPRSLALIYRQGFEQVSLRAQEFHADLEEWMFDVTLTDPDDAC